jgi:hypothetical protein
MFRKRSWSQIGLAAYTRSELVNKTRCLILPALDINGYLPGSTLVVEGAVTQAIFEHWLEAVNRGQISGSELSTSKLGVAKSHDFCIRE